MLSVIVTRLQHNDGLESVGMDVDDSDISSNYFSPLCEMPTDLIPSVWMSVIVAFSSNYFPTLCEMSTEVFPSVWTSVIVAFQVIIFQLSVKCRRTFVRRYGRR
jgi:hypothetical protein